MKLFYRFCSFAALAAVIVGCCNCRALRKSQKPLIGTEWQLVQLGGRMLDSVNKAETEADGGRFTLLFTKAEASAENDGNNLYGIGACNRYLGSYTLGENRALTISDLATTRMMCPDIETEDAYFEALRSVTHYDMDGPMLLLFSNGDLKAIFQAKAATDKAAE